jgi:hypothetical protein
MHFETTTPFPKKKESLETPEERFFLTERKVLGYLFGDDKSKISAWLFKEDGRNGRMLREMTERYLRTSEGDPDIASRIAEEIRSSDETFRAAA